MMIYRLAKNTTYIEKDQAVTIDKSPSVFQGRNMRYKLDHILQNILLITTLKARLFFSLCENSKLRSS